MPSTFWQDLKQWPRRSVAFSPITEEQPFLGDKEEAGTVYERPQRAQLNNPWLWTTVNVILLSITLVINSRHILPPIQTQTSKAINLADAVRATSSYSPVLKDIDVELLDINLNGTLFPDEHPSLFRAEPSPEVDKAWEYYEPKDAFAITSADIIEMGGDPSVAVRLPDEIFGLGDDAYMAGFDTLHKTHCLNELRKMTFEYYGEDRPVETKRHGRIWWVHLRHCVDMLMQDQLCHADADIIYFNWVDVQDNPWPDFGIRRKCRNYDQIRKWGEDRYIDYDTVVNYSKPKDAKVVPFERGYYEMYGFEGSTLYPNGTGYPW